MISHACVVLSRAHSSWQDSAPVVPGVTKNIATTLLSAGRDGHGGVDFWLADMYYGHTRAALAPCRTHKV